nr:inositol-tetrakisphosphate 1-kinase 1 [Quercus suber]
MGDKLIMDNFHSHSSMLQASIMSKYRIGYALSPKKVQSFIQNSLINQAKQRGIDLIKIDPTKPLTQQGPFDCVIHKLYGPDWNNQLRQLSLHHPNVVVIDSPESIERLHDRTSMLDVVTSLKIPQGNQTFGVPNQRVVYESENLMDSIEEVGLKFPLIAKPVTADGSAKSHEMSLVFNENGLKTLKKPIVMQEFINHGGVIFKVYVVGEHVKCVKRRSLLDISEEKLNSTAVDEGLLSFSQISNLIAKNEVGGCSELEKAVIARNKGKGCCCSEVDELVEKAEMPPLEFVMELAKGLREAMGLRLFNFDLIRDSRDGNRYFVIDINYFPGYAKMPEYESILVDFFCDLVEEKRRKVELDVKENQEWVKALVSASGMIGGLGIIHFYPELYVCSATKDARIFELLWISEGGTVRVWDLRFYRAFENWELVASYSLLQFIQPRIPWGDRRGTLCWRLKGDGKFDTQSYYQAIQGTPNSLFPWKGVWKSKIPKKFLLVTVLCPMLDSDLRTECGQELHYSP